MPDRRFLTDDLLAARRTFALRIPQPVVDVRQLAVERRESFFDLVLLFVERVDFGLRTGQLLVKNLQGRTEMAIIVRGEADPQTFQLLRNFSILRRFGRLIAGRVQLRLQLIDDICQSDEVLGDPLDLAQCVGFARLESTDPGRFFKDESSRRGVRLQNLGDLALLDDAVGGCRRTGSHERVANVFQPRLSSVDEIFRLARHPQSATDRDLVDFVGQKPLRVVERQCGFGEGAGFAAGRAVENDVLHVLAAKTLRALVAEDPFDGIHDVALARSVWPDDARDPGRKIEPRSIGKTLETKKFKILQHRDFRRESDANEGLL